MLTIRLRRQGAKRDPHYRVVVTESSTRRDGPFLEIIGHYHPRRQPAEIFFKMERFDVWLEKGAQMSDTVGSLYRRVKSGRVEEVAVASPAPSDAELEAAAAEETEAVEEATDDAAATASEDVVETADVAVDDEAAESADAAVADDEDATEAQGDDEKQG